MCEESWYECDPDRNPECTKMICYRKEIGKRFGFVGNPCRLTRKPEAARHGMPIHQISALLGHEKIDTTMKYVILNDNDLRNSYRKYA